MRLNFLVGLSLAIFILAWSPAQASYTMEATFSADNITNYIYLEEISDNSNRDFASASLTNRADWRKSDTLTIDNLEFGKTYRMYFAFENLDQANPGNPEKGESDPMGFIAKLVIDDISIVTDADWQWDEFSDSDDPGNLFQREAAWKNVHAYLDGDKYWNAYNWGYASNESELGAVFDGTGAQWINSEAGPADGAPIWVRSPTFGLINPNSEVPVPAAVWLLGSGLIGLMGLRRRFAR